MSYTPTTWKSGDVVTSEKLNKIEQGIANSGGSVEFLELDNNMALNKTAEEIIQSINSGKLLCIRINAKNSLLFWYLAGYGDTEDGPEFSFLASSVSPPQVAIFHANDSSEYPVMESQQQ